MHTIYIVLDTSGQKYLYIISFKNKHFNRTSTLYKLQHNINVGANLQHADYLQKILMVRLTSHINKRIVDTKKRERWCLKRVHKNITQMSALMVMFELTKNDLTNHHCWLHKINL